MLQSQLEILYHSSSSQKEALLKLFVLLDNPNRTLFDVLDTMPTNDTVITNITKAWSIINSPKYDGETILCSISGGADSDIVLDICTRCDRLKRIVYVFFNTGLESEATHRHLDFLEKKYNITILRKRPEKPIPLAVNLYGIPFLSKNVSEYMSRLQKYGFQWEDEPLENLLEKYCKKADTELAEQLEKDTSHGISVKWVKYNRNWYKGCVSALMWWCNAKKANGQEPSMFDIDHNPGLKEFIIANPPTFKISNKCCKYAKKDLIHNMIKETDCKLEIIGVRKAEGGSRVAAYKNCYSCNNDSTDQYRPIFWYSDKDKEEYNKYCGVQNSDCYEVYGMKRTGCAGCPYALGLTEELEIFEKYEPKLYKAINHVFRPSYEYTAKYKAFQKERKKKEK